MRCLSKECLANMDSYQLSSMLPHSVQSSPKPSLPSLNSCNSTHVVNNVGISSSVFDF